MKKKYLRRVMEEIIGWLYRYINYKPSNNQLAVFCFHEITNNPSKFQKDFDLYTSIDIFKKQIEWISSIFQIINPRDLIENSANKEYKKPRAIITFDDGFFGSFENGIKTLKEMGIPSIIFLNMRNIIEGIPMVSASCMYLEKESNTENLQSNSISKVFSHLLITPTDYFNLTKLRKEIEGNISSYQGKFATVDILRKYDDCELVSYGNHLYEHFNSLSLTNEELQYNYCKNEVELKKYSSYLNMFAFTNGRYGTCWNENTTKRIEGLGANKIFSADGKINSSDDNITLDRISLSEKVNSINKLYFRILRASY